jgi:uroporphyrin-III C-methyltransferase / precorrin-2 dehydrogenase / sirohydrochlorin ferrochelatase
MAVGNLDRIATFLLDGGRQPGTHVACIEHAGTPRQQVTNCLLANLAVSEVSRQIHSPAVVVIGPTVPVLLSDGGDRPSSGPGTPGCWTTSSVP